MAWAKPTATKNALYRAGSVLRQPQPPRDLCKDAISLVSHWRLCHALPMTMVWVGHKTGRLDGLPRGPGDPAAEEDRINSQ
jgi:hypothetical protein